MIYLTFNDPPSGIYFSQVTDTCKFLSEQFGIRVRLIAFVSIRNYWKHRRAIKKEYKDTSVLPMFPGVKNWKKNYILLSLRLLFCKEKLIIARGPFATLLALRLRKNGKAEKVCFDARGAYTAEFNEYNVSGDAELNRSIKEIEREALSNSDAQIAVSYALTKYWKKDLGFDKQTFCVIPCTLNSMHAIRFTKKDRTHFRTQLGFAEDDIVLVYSGSQAPWQSLGSVATLLKRIMEKDKRIKLLFLTPELPGELKGMSERVIHKWVSPEQMPMLLAACDHGLLVRNDSITNSVSSPVKFAEYLKYGLKIIISNNIGDYPDFVRAHDVGKIIIGDQIPELTVVSDEEKLRIAQLAQEQFSKNRFIKEYELILRGQI